MTSKEESKSNIIKIEQRDLKIIDEEIDNLQFQLTDFPPTTSKEIERLKDEINKKMAIKEELQAKINKRTVRGFNAQTQSSGKFRKIKRKGTKKRIHKKSKTKKRKTKNKNKTKKR
jgi:hypothetical protein